MKIERVFFSICLVVAGFVCGWLFATSSVGKQYYTFMPELTSQAPANSTKRVINKTIDINKTSANQPDVRVYQMGMDKWHRNDLICKNLSPYIKATLRTPAGLTPIFIHEPRDDKHVSGSIQRSGSWEGANINVIFSLLKADANSSFIDLGANIGVFTLSVAKLGRKVIAVDPLSINIKRMCASIKAGKLIDKVTLVDNALSDVRENVTMMVDKGNIGGTFVGNDKNPNKVRGSSLGGSFSGQILTMKLDDLLKIPDFDFKKVVMKIDVEGYENRVFKGGENFFKSVNVTAILMEWLWLRTGPAGAEIISFLTRHGFVPTRPTIRRENLNVNHRTSWPTDVLWRKK